MRKYIALFLLLLPVMAFAQASNDDYTIYSQYLKECQNEKKVAINFVIRETSADDIKGEQKDIKDIVESLRGCIKGDPVATSNVQFFMRSFVDTLKKDTMWVQLIAGLGDKIAGKNTISNSFSADIRTTVINDSIYNRYFEDSKHFDQNWKHFHQQYGSTALLISLSLIVNDGRRAVFYCARQCGGLCGSGGLVLFYKDGKEWRFVQYISIWMS